MYIMCAYVKVEHVYMCELTRLGLLFYWLSAVVQVATNTAHEYTAHECV